MIRAVAAALLMLVAASLAAAWVLWPPRQLPARFGTGDCHRVTLIDASSGRDVMGAEDIALAPDGETLIVSAQDRSGTPHSEAGLYAVGLRGLAAGQRVRARRLAGGHRDGLPLRPHGIGLSPDGSRLAVVNRHAPGHGVIEVGPIGPDGWRRDRRISDPRLCRANDVVFDDARPGPAGTLTVSIDRADCETSLRDLLGGTGSIARVEGQQARIERTGLDYPNGLAGGWIAETRARRLTGPGGAIALPGGPDNLTFAGDRLVVALHPNLVRTGLYLKGWIDRLSTRIAAVDPGTGAVEILYDDPSGRLFSGATVGVLAGDRLVAGSVRDAGLLYCGAAE